MSSLTKQSLPPWLILGFGLVAISVASIIVRFAQAEQIPSPIIAVWRMGLATLILSPLALRKRAEIQQMPAKSWLFALLSGSFLALHFATWIAAFEYTSVASGVVLGSTVPLWVGLLSPLLKEPVGKWLKVGIGVGILGSIIIGLSSVNNIDLTGGSNPLLGAMLALTGALAAAIYYVIGRYLRPTLSLITYTFIVYGMAALVLFIYALAQQLPLFGYSQTGYLLLLALAIFPQLLGHQSFNWAVKFYPPVMLSIALLAESIGATLLAFFLFSETPSLYTLLGGGLICLAILISSRG